MCFACLVHTTRNKRRQQAFRKLAGFIESRLSFFRQLQRHSTARSTIWLINTESGDCGFDKGADKWVKSILVQMAFAVSSENH